MAALDINPEKVSYVIAMARELEDALPDDGNREDESHRGEALDQELVEEHEYDSAYQELLSYLEALTADELNTFIALVWIGRGTFDAEEAQTALAEAAGISPKRAPAYLLSHNLLAEYLEEGLVALGLRPEEL